MSGDLVLPEHRFATPVRGPAYSATARRLTVVLVLCLLLYGVRVVLIRPDVIWPVLALMISAGAVLLVSAWYIVTGQTTIDAKGIRQEWLFTKDFAWHEISRARLVSMPLVPRLVVMTARGPFKAVHGGSPALLDAFRLIDAHYRQ